MELLNPSLQCSESTSHGELKFEKILQAILGSKSTIQSKIHSVAVNFGLLIAVHCKLVDRIENNKYTLATTNSEKKGPTERDNEFQSRGH